MLEKVQISVTSFLNDPSVALWIWPLTHKILLDKEVCDFVGCAKSCMVMFHKSRVEEKLINPLHASL